jgi:hypothetical protein
MTKEEPTAKGIPPAIYALAGTIITAMAGILVVYVQIIVPKQIELHATQTAEILHINQTETALARIPTYTFTPTFAPTNETLTPTPSPSPTLATEIITPTLTATPTTFILPAGSEYCVNAQSVYVREGPGTFYNAFGALTFRDCPFFDARNPDSTWIRLTAGQPGYEALGGGWVRADLVRPPDFEMLPVIEPTPTPEPTPTFTPTATPLG